MQQLHQIPQVVHSIYTGSTNYHFIKKCGLVMIAQMGTCIAVVLCMALSPHVDKSSNHFKSKLALAGPPHHGINAFSNNAAMTGHHNFYPLTSEVCASKAPSKRQLDSQYYWELIMRGFHSESPILTLTFRLTPSGLKDDGGTATQNYD
jgi:hypothetical protein